MSMVNGMIEHATRLASHILASRGEISLSEIENLPGVASRETALMVADRLRQGFSTYTERRRVPVSRGIVAWEIVIVLQGGEAYMELPQGYSPRTAQSFTRSELDRVLRRTIEARTIEVG
jgi:hypothetical protein